MRQVIALTCALYGCGGGLSSSFTGAWRGTEAISVPSSPNGSGTDSVDFAITTSTDGSALITGLCSSGQGTVQLTGDGREGSWKGLLVCPFPSSTCATTAVSYSSMTAKLSDDDVTLSANLAGLVVNCKIPPPGYDVSIAFSGTKQ